MAVTTPAARSAMRCLEMPDATRSGNCAASSPTVAVPRSASRSRMPRRVGSARTRNRSSLDRGIIECHKRGQLLQHLVAVRAALVCLDCAWPAGLADTGEPVVDEGYAGPGDDRRQGE